ncbi:MAG TPA: hypothetical protein VJ801_13740 [Polyangia bacterium]|jgi:hypothetical protein|nr:hypothetical protein [Polyangia bacterium]
MHFLRAHFACSVLVLAGGLCLAACSKDEKTAIEVDVTLGGGVTQQPDAVRFVVTRGGTTFIDRQANWSDASAGKLKVTLLLPAEAAGEVTLEVHATSGAIEIAQASRSSIRIEAGKAYGPIAVALDPVVVTIDGGADALPNDGPEPDLAAGPEAGKPDAGVTPDTSIDRPGAEAAAPEAPVPSDGVQSVEVEPSSDALQLSDGADAGADSPRTTDVGADAPLAADAVEAGADTGADSLAAFAWQPVENAQYDPQDPLGSSVGYPYALAVAVDPLHDHVYVMWIDWAASAVRVRRWDALKAQWGDTYTLEENPGGNPEVIQIGVDGAGHVIAAWFHWDPKDTTLLGVRSSQSTDGVSWSAPARITPNRQVAEASLAVARNGTARLAFTVWDSENSYIPLLYSAYYDGKTWTAGPDALAAQPAVSSPSYPSPSVAISDQGSGIILFTQMDDQLNDSVAVATFAGPDLDPYRLLDSNVSNGIDERAVVVNRNGEGAVVWGDNGAMLSSYSPSTKMWTTAKKIGDVGLRQPTMVMASDGTITLAWSQGVDSSYNVWTLEGTVSGNWTAPMPLEQDNLSIPNNQYASETTETLPYPSLAVDGAGNVLALWLKKTKDTPTHEFAVEARRKLAGKANDWQPTTELARKSILVPVSPSLAVGDHGLGAASYYWANPGTTSLPDSHTVFVSLFR